MDQLTGVNIRPVELEVYTKSVQTDLTLEGIVIMRFSIVTMPVVIQCDLPEV